MATVTITQGKLKGNEAVTVNGLKYFEFLNIPYAKPPVGDLRFKSPQSPEPWEGERDATKSNLENTPCQNNVLKPRELTGSEDCLYLNVYTPQLPSSGSKLLPVMISVHGGGLVRGNGTIKDFAGPNYLIDKGVIFVAMNYRVNVLGFLSLDIPECSGNMGLKDQVKSFEWVQKNIDKFGGDKNNVTIFGESGGAASVEFQILSPMSRGIFHKAILQSGSALNGWAINFEYEQLTLDLADKLEFKGDKKDKYALYDFFMKVPVEKLIDACFIVSDIKNTKSVRGGFVATVEKIRDEAFLTDNPYTLFKEGRFAKVPVIRGFCNKEGFLMLALKPIAFNELVSSKRFSDYWFYQFEEDDEKKYHKRFTEAYLETVKPDDDHDDFAADFFGDYHFAAGSWIASIFTARYGVPEYVYSFTYDGKLNALKTAFGIKKKGAAHGDDVCYVYSTSQFNTQPDDADISFRNNMTQMWTDFAKTSNPTPGNSSVKWPIFTEQSKLYVNLDKDITVETNYEPEKMEIFQEIYEKYQK